MAKGRKRHAFEKGHKRKFLVVVDGTPECAIAAYFAARVANRTGGTLALLHVITPTRFGSWSGVQVADSEIGQANADTMIEQFRSMLRDMDFKNLDTEAIIREGDKSEEILNVIEHDRDIAVLVLGAASDRSGPGPLVSSLAAGRRAGEFPIPIYIVPGTLTVEEIEALA